MSEANQSGWVCLHRSLLTHPLMEQLPDAWLKIWIMMLLRANWQTGKWWDGKREISIAPGSFVTSLDKLASKSGSGVQQVRNALKYLEATGMITRQATHSYTTITITNWATYQDPKQDDNTPANMRDNTPATEQQHSDNTAATTIEQLNKNNKEQESNSDELEAPRRSSRKSKQKTKINPDVQRWFDAEFWPIYPRHEAKAEALKAANEKAVTDERRAYYLGRLRAQLPAYQQRKAERGQSTIPLGSTWFHQDRAEDELQIAPEPGRRGLAIVTGDYPEYVSLSKPVSASTGESNRIESRSLQESMTFGKGA